MPSIDIPSPALIVRSDMESRTSDWAQIFTVSVTCGSVTVFERKYCNEYEDADYPEYAYDVDQAEDKALDEFGNKLKELLS